MIKLGEPFTRVEVDGLKIKAGSAARISRVADIAATHDLSGLEGVGTVPGSLGGAIVMNAGTHRGYIDEVTESVSVVTETGEKRVLGHKECGFTYRNSRFQWDRSMIITFAAFNMRKGDGRGHRRASRKRETAHGPRLSPRARARGVSSRIRRG